MYISSFLGHSSIYLLGISKCTNLYFYDEILYYEFTFALETNNHKAFIIWKIPNSLSYIEIYFKSPIDLKRKSSKKN